MEIKIIVPRNEVVVVNNGNVIDTQLQENEFLVDVGNFNDFIKPVWNDGWTESATEEEIALIESYKVSKTSEVDKLWDAINYLINSSYEV